MRLTAHILLVGWLGLQLGAVHAQQRKITWKFAPKQELKYEMTQDMDLEMAVGDRPITSQVKQTMDIRWLVDKVDEQGVADVAQTVDRVRQSISGLPLGEVKYDSASPPENDQGAVATQMRSLFANLIGKPTLSRISPSGEVSDVKLPEGLGGEGQAITREALQEFVGKSALVFPAEDVQPGAKWSGQSTMKMNQIGEMQVDNQYEIISLEGDVATIRVTPTLKILAAENAAFKIDAGKQTGQGSIRFDVKQGHILSSEITQDIEFDIKVQNQTIKQKLHQVVKMNKVNTP